MAIKKRARGRPPKNPGDVKSSQIAMRIHPDLNDALIKVARSEGISRAALINRLVIESVNDRRSSIGLNNIGRHSVRVAS
jgi:hypothetical protein